VVVRKRERRADHRVTGERHFAGEAEDTQTDVGVCSLGREHERALGEVHLARHLRHRIGVESGRVGEHRELIACQR
jgi:hypothetical protein